MGRTNLVIGLFFMALGCLAALVWIPLDSQTGLIQTARGRQSIGDALAPTVACGFLVLGGALSVLTERGAPSQPKLTAPHVILISRLLGVIVCGVLIMRYAGPALAELANPFREEPIAYRVLRASAGWRHVGFALGGIVIVAGLIAMIERKLSRHGLIAALLAVLVIIAIFDLPFEDLLLPPNGDV